MPVNRDENYPYSYSQPLINRGSEFVHVPTMQELRSSVAPFRFALAAREIVRTLQIRDGDSVLELGSGLGLLGEKILEQIPNASIRYYGVDLNYNSARASGERGLLSVCADINNLPFSSDTFDYLVTTDVLEHISKPSLAVTEMFRVLKPGGGAFVVIADPSEARFNYVVDHIPRTDVGTDVSYWEKQFLEAGFEIDVSASQKFRQRDWRRVFNLPLVRKLKDYPGFACAFNPVYRPGVYVIRKLGGQEVSNLI